MASTILRGQPGHDHLAQLCEVAARLRDLLASLSKMGGIQYKKYFSDAVFHANNIGSPCRNPILKILVRSSLLSRFQAETVLRDLAMCCFEASLEKEIDWHSFADNILQNADNRPVLAIIAPLESEIKAAFSAVFNFFKSAMIHGPEKASKKAPTDFEMPTFQVVSALCAEGAFGRAVLDAVLQATYKEDDTHYEKVSAALLQIIAMAVTKPLSDWVGHLEAVCQTHTKSLPPPYSAVPSAPPPPSTLSKGSAPASAPVSAGSRPLKS
jgi:hypothetical protein